MSVSSEDAKVATCEQLSVEQARQRHNRPHTCSLRVKVTFAIENAIVESTEHFRSSTEATHRCVSLRRRCVKC